jgi:hypothetical protein
MDDGRAPPHDDRPRRGASDHHRVRWRTAGLDGAGSPPRRPRGAPHPVATARGRPACRQRLRHRRRRAPHPDRRRLGAAGQRTRPAPGAEIPRAGTCPTSAGCSSPTSTATTTPRRSPFAAATARRWPSAAASAPTCPPSTTAQARTCCHNWPYSPEQGPRTWWQEPDIWLADRTAVPLEGRVLRAIATPGHTRGHTVFHDESAGVLFAGDHVLPHITPSIGFEPAPPPSPLSTFLTSLELRRTPHLDPPGAGLRRPGPVQPDARRPRDRRPPRPSRSARPPGAHRPRRRRALCLRFHTRPLLNRGAAERRIRLPPGW